MAEWKIGEKEFIFGDGNPPPLNERITLIQRPGTDGTILRKEGTKGVPFQLVTTRDFVDMSAAQTELLSYLDLQNAPQVLIWNDVNWATTHNAQVGVVSVIEEEKFRVAKGVGGFEGENARVLLRARWTLIFIRNV